MKKKKKTGRGRGKKITKSEAVLRLVERAYTRARGKYSSGSARLHARIKNLLTRTSIALIAARDIIPRGVDITALSLSLCVYRYIFDREAAALCAIIAMDKLVNGGFVEGERKN